LGSAGGDLNTMRAEMFRFAEQYRRIRKRWELALNDFAAQGKHVALWGAGAKGAMFLNTFRDQPAFEYIVDVNPHKHGLYIPGTGQKVVGPEFLREYRPDALIIVNPNYQDEISRQVKELGLRPELLPI
jgi:FlaA1/EpsC-like NDP-sugar epimerase